MEFGSDLNSDGPDNLLADDRIYCTTVVLFPRLQASLGVFRLLLHILFRPRDINRFSPIPFIMMASFSVSLNSSPRPAFPPRAAFWTDSSLAALGKIPCKGWSNVLWGCHSPSWNYGYFKGHAGQDHSGTDLWKASCDRPSGRSSVTCASGH